ncbi:MAG: TraB family protein, partial [Bdellovibrionales bacterium]|nr:TraB family protein [Bdellovibrionales bacterium]
PRYHSLIDPDRWKNTDIISVFKQGKIYVLMAQLGLAAFQKKLGNQLNIKPGAEMMRALEVAKEVGAENWLADREIRTTLARTWSALGLWSGITLMSSLVVNLIGSNKIDQAEIERMKSVDVLEELMGEFGEKLPTVRKTLIDERDQYLAQRIKAAPGKKVVAVVGAGHVPGIKCYINQQIDLAPLEVIPPTGQFSKVIGWTILFIFLAMVAYGFINSGAATTFDMAKSWFIITGFSAALGSALALAHPLTVICSFLTAPITTLHPILGSGWVAGFVEALLRRPRVVDFENIADDLGSIRSIFKNRIGRILAVFVLTSLFGALGMFLALGSLASFL